MKTEMGRFPSWRWTRGAARHGTAWAGGPLGRSHSLMPTRLRSCMQAGPSVGNARVNVKQGGRASCLRVGIEDCPRSRWSCRLRRECQE